MPTPEVPRRIYALVPAQEESATSDYAPMEQARLLADRCNGFAAALLIGDAPGPAIERARRQTREGRACLLEFITREELRFPHRRGRPE